jgi:hypothetical protein
MILFSVLWNPDLLNRFKIRALRGEIFLESILSTNG